MTGAIYDTIGKGYATQRRPEPSWEQQILAAVGPSSRVLNVGAGTGSYEPEGRVVALEPSAEMLSQRRNQHPVVRGVAEHLPFADGVFDVAMAVLTVHHWTDQNAGLDEMRRVARRQVLFVFESLVTHTFWLLDYFPEILANAVEQNAPTVESVGSRLNVTDVQTIWIPADCADGVAAAYWRRPEAYLLPEVQRSMSALALLSDDDRSAGTERLRSDLHDGSWHRKFGGLRDQSRADYGYRLVIAED